MLPIILTICLTGLIIGTITDLKTREVPDWINYSLIFAGVGIATINSIISWNLDFILESLLGLGIFFIIAYVMYYTGQWGGGDSKMIMGLGALVGISIPLSSWLNINALNDGFPFMINFILYSIVVGAVYGLIWSTILALIHRKRLIKEIKKILTEKKVNLIKKIILSIIVIGIITSIFLPNDFRLLVLTIAMIIGITFYMFIYIKSIEKVCMLKEVVPEKLTIGDWIAEDIKIGKKVICGPSDLGIEKDQIEKLIQLKNKGKIKMVLIKEGIPFVPSFLIAFLISLFFKSKLILFFL